MASKTFDNLKPERDVHNPNNLGSGQHLYKLVVLKLAKDEALPDHTLVVAWKGKDPIHNEIRDVQTEDEKAAALRDGWSPEPVLREISKKGTKE